MPDRDARRSPASNPSGHPCRIAKFLGVNAVDAACLAGSCDGAVPSDGNARWCGRCECPNARLLFDLIFDELDPPDRAQMH